jgi:hypothetical protein
LARSLRCGHLGLGMHIGSAPMDLTNRSTYLFGAKVLPHLRPIWSEWEDHWWPKALPEDKREKPGGHNAAVQSWAERPMEEPL